MRPSISGWPAGPRKSSETVSQSTGLSSPNSRSTEIATDDERNLRSSVGSPPARSVSHASARIASAADSSARRCRHCGQASRWRAVSRNSALSSSASRSTRSSRLSSQPRLSECMAVLQLADFLTQPGQHAAARDVNRAVRDPQRSGCVLDRMLLDAGHPECAPSCRLHRFPDPRGGPAEQLVPMLEDQLFGDVIGRRLPLQPLEDAARSAANRLTPLFAEQVQKLVPGDFEQPRAKPAPLGVRLPAVDGLHVGDQHVLHQLARVGIRKAAATCKPIDERLINRNKLAPRICVFMTRQPQNQARPSLRHSHVFSCGPFPHVAKLLRDAALKTGDTNCRRVGPARLWERRPTIFLRYVAWPFPQAAPLHLYTTGNA